MKDLAMSLTRARAMVLAISLCMAVTCWCSLSCAPQAFAQELTTGTTISTQAVQPAPAGVHELYLCGEMIVGHNPDNDGDGPEYILVPPTMPGVSYDAATNTLTLNNASLTLDNDYVSAAISYLGTTDFTIKLVGSNTITAKTQNAGIAIQAGGVQEESKQGSLSIVGGGSLKTVGFAGLVWQDWISDYGTDKTNVCSNLTFSDVTVTGEGDGIVSNYGNLTIKNSKITIAASDPRGRYGITTGRAGYNKQYYGKLTIANSRVELKYTGTRFSSNRTTLAWNTLDLSGENVYIGEKSAEGKVNLDAYAEKDESNGRRYCTDRYLLITTEKLNVPTLTVATPKIVLSKKKFAYNGKVQKPTVTVKVDGKVLAASNYTITWPAGCKDIGSYNVEVTLKGQYRGHEAATYDIVPKATVLKKLVPKKKAITVKWRKASGKFDGYEIQYSLKKNFKSAKAMKVKGAKKTSATIKKLKRAKKYFVRIRTYKEVEYTYGTEFSSTSWTETYYSNWSKTKAIRTK